MASPHARRRRVEAVEELTASAINLESGDTIQAATSLMVAAVILGHQLGVTRGEMLSTVEDLFTKCEASMARQVSRG